MQTDSALGSLVLPHIPWGSLLWPIPVSPGPGEDKELLLLGQALGCDILQEPGGGLYTQ